MIWCNVLFFNLVVLFTKNNNANYFIVWFCMKSIFSCAANKHGEPESLLKHERRLHWTTTEAFPKIIATGKDDVSNVVDEVVF